MKLAAVPRRAGAIGLIVGILLTVLATTAAAEPQTPPQVARAAPMAPVDPNPNPLKDNPDRRNCRDAAATPSNLLGDASGRDPRCVPLNRYAYFAKKKKGGGAFSGPSLTDEDLDLKIGRQAINGTFSLSRTVTGVCMWLLDWTLNFKVAKSMLEPAHNTARAWQTNVISRLGLPAFFVVVTIVWASFIVMRGHAARGISEVLISLFIAALAGMVAANPASMVDFLASDNGLLGQTKKTSLTLTTIASENWGGAGTGSNVCQTCKTNVDDIENADPAKPINDGIALTYVVVPHQMLNYGRALEYDPKFRKCRDLYRQALEAKPKDGASAPEADDINKKLDVDGCKSLVETNKRGPSWDAFFAALLLLAAVLILLVLVAIVSFTLTVATVMLCIAAMFSPLVLVIAILPGVGRDLLYSYTTTVVRSVFTVGVSILFFPFYHLISGTMVKTEEGNKIFVAFLILVIATGGGITYYHRAVNAAVRAGQMIGDRLKWQPVGGAGYAHQPGPMQTYMGRMQTRGLTDQAFANTVGTANYGTTPSMIARAERYRTNARRAGRVAAAPPRATRWVWRHRSRGARERNSQR